MLAKPLSMYDLKVCSNASDTPPLTSAIPKAVIKRRIKKRAMYAKTVAKTTGMIPPYAFLKKMRYKAVTLANAIKNGRSVLATSQCFS